MTDELKEAIALFGLSETVTINGIEVRYHEMLLKWHPDTCRENSERCHEMTRKIIQSYKILMLHCRGCPILISEAKVVKNLSPDAYWEEHFGDDWMWGRGFGKRF